MDTPNGAPELAWRQSSYCESNGCVQVARFEGRVAVRSSLYPETTAEFSEAVWGPFIDDIKAGKFDRPPQ